MTPHRRRLACALVGALGLSLCTSLRSQTAPKPRRAARPAAGVDMKRLASEVWIYAFPLVLTDVTREVQSGAAAPNTFRHRRTIPDATTHRRRESERRLPLLAGVARPVQGPGDPVGARRPRAAITCWRFSTPTPTSPAPSASARPAPRSASSRSSDRSGRARCREDTSEVRSPTELAWIFGRTAVSDKADLANAVKIQDQYKLRRRAAPPAKGAKAPRRRLAPAAVDTKTPPRDQVAAMDATRFFTRVAMLLARQSADQGRRARCSPRSSSSASSPASPSRQAIPRRRRALDEGVKTAIDAVAHGLQGPERRRHPQRLAHRSRARPLGHRVRTPRGGGVERHRRQRARGCDLHEHVPRRHGQEARRHQSLRPALRRAAGAARPTASGR